MGIYDREYYREEERSGMFATRTMVINLMLITAAVYVAQLIFDEPQFPGQRPDPHRQPLLYWLSLDSEFWRHPWQAWRLVTYGFLHSRDDFKHIFFNMFGLWLFGRDVEGVYGRVEFVRIYLTAIVVAGLAWLLGEQVMPHGENHFADVVGASGGVMSIILIYVLHYPKRTFYLFPIPIPVPAWALGTFYVLADILGINAGGNVAHIAHLGGAAYGYVYYRTRWSFGRLVPGNWSLSRLKFKPRLKIHDPTVSDRDLTSEVDRILEKISRDGEASLTKEERGVLERAARKYQQRRR